MKTELSINELKKGDVLLFSVLQGDIISSLIGLLTNSDVSHAALYADEEKQTLLEATGEHPVLENPARERFAGRTVHVYRNRALPSLDPVVETGRKYLQQKLPYGGIYLLGLLLVTSKYCRFRWDRETAGAAICLLASTYQALRSLLEGSHPTAFCSQFVAKCYEEAGEPYQLHYKQPVIPLDACAGDGERSLLLEALEEMDSGELNIDSANPDGYEENFMIQELSENVFDPEKHGAILLQSARDAMAACPENGGFVCSSFKEKVELVIWTGRVAYVWYCLLTHKKNWKSLWSRQAQKEALLWLNEHRSSFIAPSDFKNTGELSCEGCIAGN
ncbi:MAG: hypothetical protein LUE13_09930 [Akkermansiaceae bacterium]|nr:hypothetical protein [Akkermansiaceae bacterium]